MRNTPSSRSRRRFSPLIAVTGSLAVVAALTIAGLMPANAEVQPDTVSMVAPEPAQQVTQLAEKNVQSGRVAVSGKAAAAPTKVCHTGAQWLRLRFTELSLRGNDSILLSGNKGGSYTLTGKNWPGKAFHTRAFQGDCVQLSPRLTDPASSYSVDAYQSGTESLAQATVTVAAVGDICGSSCNQTAPVVKAMNPAALILAGDNAYGSGTLSEYNNNYHPYYGQFKSITYPTPGNHEYNTSGASGYFDYFGAAAGERGKGYYSFDVGDWHFIALNSNIDRGASSAQVTWLKNDIQANTKPCTAAYWHHPRFNKGDHGDDSSITPMWDALAAGKADLIIVGHDHNYQRFNMARSNGTVDTTNGIRQIVYGTGGRGFYGLGGSTSGPLQASNADTFGVGKLTLTATGYTAQFMPVSGRTYTDTATGSCKDIPTGPDFSVTANPTSLSIPQGGSGTVGVSVASINNFNAATTLSVSGLPAGVTATVSPNPVTPPANGTVNATISLSATATATPGTANLTVTGTSGSLSHNVQVQLSVEDNGGGAVWSDNFETSKGWTVNASGSDTATTGQWERGDPEQTVSSNNSQIKQLGTTPSGVNCLVTGRLAGASDGAYDVDGGVTTIRSPQISVPAGGTASLSFQFSYAHQDNSGTDDYLRVKVIDGATSTTVFQRTGTAATARAGVWEASGAIDLTAYAGKNISLQVESADVGTASLWESQVDDVRITSTSGGGDPDFTLNANPNSLSIPQGEKNTTTATITSVGGFSSAVNLAVSGAPAGVTTTWETNPVTPPSGASATSQLVIATTPTTATGSFTLTVTGTSGALSHSATVAVSVTGAGGGGFSDDFETNKGWTVNPSGSDTATTGRWERGDPDQTTAANTGGIKQLGTTTSGSNCLVTARLAGASDGANDVDGGSTSIRSPQFTVPSGTVSLRFQYSVAHGSNSTTADYFRIKVVDGATVTTVFQVLGAASTERDGAWSAQNINFSAYAGKSVYLLVETADADTASLWEAQVDDLSVTAG